MVTLLTPARAAMASMVAAAESPFDQEVGARLEDGQPGPLAPRAAGTGRGRSPGGVHARPTYIMNDPYRNMLG